jgi:glycosyltransferase involved in cell wall biosynthesis
MISVIMWCYSKQDLLDQTLPNWLNQKGVDYEIVIVHGTEVKIKPHPLVNMVKCSGGFNICKAYNQAVSEARGDILLITQCDMLLKSDYELKLMFENYKPDRMVKAVDFPFLHICMVSKEAIIKAGGWHEPFGELYAYEDTDLVATLIEQGIKNFYIHGANVEHIKHDKPDLTDELREKYAKSKALYEARHK